MKRNLQYFTVQSRRTLRFLPLIATCSLLLAARPVSAGTICGTVRDAITAIPIGMAGVFVRTPSGEYTGYHGATNDLGEFCIDEIPPGTYDLEVRVDNYMTGYLRNVEVSDDPTSVQIGLAVPVYFAPPWPNPAQGAISFRFRAGENAPVRLLIFDPAGRLVRGWSDPDGTSGDRLFVWNLTDYHGAPIPSGVYYVRFSAGDINFTRSIVIVK